MSTDPDRCRLLGPFPMELMEKADCCVACHLSWEEQHVLPYLPPQHREWILADHALMRAYRQEHGDWPRNYLLEHADREDPLFGRYLPMPLLRRMQYEHKVLDWKAKNGLPLDD